MPLRAKKNLFYSHAIKETGVHFVKLIYVGEIGFQEWTKDNKLRQPRFLGLRYDKATKNVVKES